MNDTIRRLAWLRHNIAEQEAMLARKEQELQATVEWQEVDHRRGHLQARKAEEKEAGAEVRKAAMAIFAETGSKTPHPAIKIKMYAVLEYRDEDAVNYAREHLPGALKLDKRVFARAAKAVAMDFVAILQEPRATIARDLSKYLPQE